MSYSREKMNLNHILNFLKYSFLALKDLEYLRKLNGHSQLRSFVMSLLNVTIYFTKDFIMMKKYTYFKILMVDTTDSFNWQQENFLGKT